MDFPSTSANNNKNAPSASEIDRLHHAIAAAGYDDPSVQETVFFLRLLLFLVSKPASTAGNLARRHGWNCLLWKIFPGLTLTLEMIHTCRCVPLDAPYASESEGYDATFQRVAALVVANVERAAFLLSRGLTRSQEDRGGAAAAAAHTDNKREREDSATCVMPEREAAVHLSSLKRVARARSSIKENLDAVLSELKALYHDLKLLRERVCPE